MEFTFAFISYLVWGLFLTLPPLLLFFVVIACLGLLTGRIENWERFDSIYWAFVTALTVGYGDLHPQHKLSKILALLIAVVGIMVFGIIVAIAVNTFSRAFAEFVELPVSLIEN